MGIKVWDDNGTVMCQWSKGGPVWVLINDVMQAYEIPDIEQKKNVIAKISPNRNNKLLTLNL